MVGFYPLVNTVGDTAAFTSLLIGCAGFAAFAFVQKHWGLMLANLWGVGWTVYTLGGLL